MATNELAVLERASRAISEVVSIGEAKELADKAAAIKVLAAKQNWSERERLRIAEIEVRATARLGELLVDAEVSKPHAGPGRGKTGSSGESVLGGLGVSPKQSHVAQLIASVPEPKREELIAASRESGHLSVTGMARAAKGIRDGTAAHVSHNSGDNEWYTPPEYIEAARRAMGGIDCDPASSDIANQTVKAEVYYTLADDGLLQTWRGRVWMNPPYGQPICGQFCEALSHKKTAGEIEQACILVNNATETRWFAGLVSVCSAVVFPTGRIKYLKPEGEIGPPLQGQAVLYAGSNTDAFTREFGAFGWGAYIWRQ